MFLVEEAKEQISIEELTRHAQTNKETIVTATMEGSAVRRKRIERGLTQNQLTMLTGLSSQSYVSKIESGAKKPNRRTLGRLARALGCEVEDLV